MEDSESKKQVSDRMIDSIFQDLERLNHYDRICKEGVENMPELLAIPVESWDVVLPSARLKGMGLFITEFEILFSKAKTIIAAEKYNAMTSKLKLISEGYNRNALDKDGKMIVYKSRTINKRTLLVLDNGFFFLSNQLSKLKTELFESLSHVLYAVDKTKSNKNIPL